MKSTQHITATAAVADTHEAHPRRLRDWLSFGLFAAATLVWFADLARWLAPA
jgi:hypothetical protein